MYFCPCSYNDPVDPETEENAFFSLPRNLSYVQDSYLDRYSVSARFVHNPKIERSIQHQQGQEWKSNVEDETLGLLSAITAQELSGRCDGDFESVTSSGFVFPRPDSPTESVYSKCSTEPATVRSVGQSSPFSASSLLHPASLVASKISSFLHSPPNESMDSARDIGSSVDGDNLISLISKTAARSDLSPVDCPDSSGEEMDRGGGVFFYSSSHSDSDIEERDAAVDHADVHSGESAGDGTNISEMIQHCQNPDHQPDTISDDATDTHWSNSSIVQANLKPYGSGGKTHFPKPNNDDDINEEGADEPTSTASSSYSCETSHYPALKSLDVESKIYIPQENILPKREKEYPAGMITVGGSSLSYGSPDSDGFSEEGVFVNIDDLDSTTEKSTTVSDASDDTCVSADSMFLSPEECEFEEDSQEPFRKMTLEEAISRAATDLTKMSLEIYGSGKATAATSESSSSASLDMSEEDSGFSVLTMRTAGRTSPVRVSSGLKIKITDPNEMETSSRLTDSSTTLSDSPMYSEHEFNFNRVELRKSSSLKSNKTPPGTPHRKKVVRFADAMGLDLESVRHVLNMESPPKIPPSALADLMKGLNEENREIGSKYLCACFNQPGAADNFFQKVRDLKVSLENAIINDLTITGFIRVANISYHKSVRVRYTHNGWSTFHDIAASYVQNSCDGPTDRFSFSIVAPPYFGQGSRLEFAVSYSADGCEYWDNNDGKNYVFECFAKSIPTDSETAWLHFL